MLPTSVPSSAVPPDRTMRPSGSTAEAAPGGTCPRPTAVAHVPVGTSSGEAFPRMPNSATTRMTAANRNRCARLALIDDANARARIMQASSKTGKEQCSPSLPRDGHCPNTPPASWQQPEIEHARRLTGLSERRRQAIQPPEEVTEMHAAVGNAERGVYRHCVSQRGCHGLTCGDL